MKHVVLIFLLLLSSGYAQVLTQQECSSIDIRTTNPHIRKSSILRNHFTVPRNQDSIGWCYGFAAADLLSAHLGADISSFHTSALYNRKARKNLLFRFVHGLALKSSKDSFEEVYQGGMCKMALAEAIKNGKVCREKALPFDYPHSGQTRVMIMTLEGIRKERKAYSEENLCNAVNYILNTDNNLSVDAGHITEELISKNMNLVLDKIGNEQCKNNGVVVHPFKVRGIPTTNGYNIEKSKLFLNRISDLLQNGKPIEVTYDVKHYTDMRGLHSSVVTARRWQDGKCQFKIRNSWGKSCAGYNDFVDCEKETGSFWVNDEHFVKATRSTTYIE